ncbi:MAG TPA: DegT/DnrJ/EryC1/StrS family aminotransferase [Candidatus Micrarchaeaceae archaeon]|nr:DegT/DnrJ/EryC1/StrS family aminotransferase [Candidatus Micrarchaeaceae archaeon]
MKDTSGHRPLALVDLRLQHANLRHEIDAAIDRVFQSSAFILGEEARAFEMEFAALCGTEYAVACANGTDALELALWAVGVKPNDEVITVAHTFAATAEAIVRVGAIPRFVDVTGDTLLMDLALVEQAITPKTTAIVPVHLYGSCVDMVALMNLARRHGLKVVEDSAQAHGAMVGAKRAGSVGDAGTFSFYPGKNLGAVGDAGAVVTHDPMVAQLISSARDHGRSGKYEHEMVGRNSRMDGIQAAVLRVKLARLNEWNQRRRLLAARYRFLLEDLPEVQAVAASVGEPVYHMFVIECDERDEVKQRLHELGIATGVHYPIPLHLQRAFANASGMDRGSLPVTENAAGRILSLPMFPEMADSDVDRVVAALSDVVRASAAHP